jgi:hypothetical protein
MSLPAMECPICQRVWTPTPFDDCVLPGCGCFGTELDRDTPCEGCGITHAWNCPKLPGRAERVAATTNPKLAEIWPDGRVVYRGSVSQDPEK